MYPAAAQQMEQDRLGLIVLVMGGDHRPRTDATRLIEQDAIALTARGLFETHSGMDRLRRCWNSDDAQFQPKRRGKVRCALRIVSRFWVQAVIDMQELLPDAQHRFRSAQDGSESQRVAPAGEANDESIIRGQTGCAGTRQQALLEAVWCLPFWL